MPDLSIALKEEELVQVLALLPEALREGLAQKLDEAALLLLKELAQKLEELP